MCAKLLLIKMTTNDNFAFSQKYPRANFDSVIQSLEQNVEDMINTSQHNSQKKTTSMYIITKGVKYRRKVRA